jgi:hypothetical protein
MRKYKEETYLLLRFMKNVIIMYSSSMIHEVQMALKDHVSLPTSGIRARNWIIRLVVVEMSLGVVPCFVNGSVAVEPDLVGLT